ncbi:hypothetical protein Tco_1549600 [Tanacetum coccineum]
METKAYKTYLAFATGNAIPKKAKKRTTAHITPIKESSLTADDNIISINRTEAKEHEATRLVHETHERLVTENPTRRRKETGVIFRDTPIVSTKKTPPQSLKLKGMEMLSDAAMLADDTRKAIKASKHDLRSQHQSSGSSEGAYEDYGFEEDEVVLISKDERTDFDDDKSIDLNKTYDEEETQRDDFVHTSNDYVPTNDETHDVDDKEYIRINEELYDDVNVEMKDVEPADEGKGDEEMTDVEKDEVHATTIVAPATQKEKNDVPPSSSSRSVSSNYGSIFLNLDNPSSAETEIISMLDVQVQQEIPIIQSISLLIVPVLVILEPTVIKPPEIVTTTSTTTIPPFIPPFIPISQQSTPPPIPTTSTITTSNAPTSTSINPKSKTLSAL